MKCRNSEHWVEFSQEYRNISTHTSDWTWYLASSPLHPTPIARKDKPKNQTPNGFHVTIHYETGFKNISKSEVRGTCIERLRKMNIAQGTK